MYTGYTASSDPGNSEFHFCIGFFASPEPGLTQQCAIILTENGTKGSEHLNKSFGLFFKNQGELFLKTTSKKKKIQEVLLKSIHI